VALDFVIIRDAVGAVIVSTGIKPVSKPSPTARGAGGHDIHQAQKAKHLQSKPNSIRETPNVHVDSLSLWPPGCGVVRYYHITLSPVKGYSKNLFGAWSRAGAPGQRARGEIVASDLVPAGWPGSGAGGRAVARCAGVAAGAGAAGGRAWARAWVPVCRCAWARVVLGGGCAVCGILRSVGGGRVVVFVGRLVMRGIPCGVMGWLVWSWLFGVVWFTLATKLAMQKHPISVLYFCWLANPLAGRNRLSGAGHWTLGFPSFPRRPLI